VLQRQHQERWGSRKRFEREARALAQLSHEHIVAVSDCGVDGDVPFLVMELLEGESLEARLKQGALPPAVACELLLQLLAGLAFVHEHGLVHRDIKPGNLFLERTAQGERLKLLDFGLAKLLAPGSDASLTLSGEVFGTPAYMPPEQITGEAIDARSDVYAVGLVAFEMMAGRCAFRGHDSELLRQQLVEPVPRLEQLKRALEYPLDDWLQRATAKEKDLRFPSAREMSQALRALVPERPAAHSRATRTSGLPGARARAQRRGRNGGVAGNALRAGALLVCVLAFAAIVVAGTVIVLIDSPRVDSQRARWKAAIASIWDSER
jgi:serine/threonine-protein kinase